MEKETVAVAVWDGWVRLFHWATVGAVATSVISGKAGWWQIHYASGYTLLTLVLFRVLWGVVGSQSARFGTFLRGPRAVAQHLRMLFRREPDWAITHNPAGGWMVAVLLLLLAAQAISGLFANHDPGFTYSQHGPLAPRVSEAMQARLTAVHLRLADWLLVAIGLHIAAVLFYRVVKGQDLVAPMISGRKHLPLALSRRLRPAPCRRGVLVMAIAAGVVWAVLFFAGR